MKNGQTFVPDIWSDLGSVQDARELLVMSHISFIHKSLPVHDTRTCLYQQQQPVLSPCVNDVSWRAGNWTRICLFVGAVTRPVLDFSGDPNMLANRRWSSLHSWKCPRGEKGEVTGWSMRARGPDVKTCQGPRNSWRYPGRLLREFDED